MRILLPLLLLVPLCAQTPQDAPKKGGGGGMGGPPKNLKVLKVEGRELLGVMRSYTVALGVRCDFCHVAGQPPDFSSDANPKKETARHMISMVQDISAKYPDTKEHVTCYTCHAGSSTPKSAPPPAQ